MNFESCCLLLSLSDVCLGLTDCDWLTDWPSVPLSACLLDCCSHCLSLSYGLRLTVCRSSWIYPSRLTNAVRYTLTILLAPWKSWTYPANRNYCPWSPWNKNYRLCQVQRKLLLEPKCRMARKQVDYDLPNVQLDSQHTRHCNHSLVLLFYHRFRVGLINGFLKELLQCWKENSAKKIHDSVRWAAIIRWIQWLS